MRNKHSMGRRFLALLLCALMMVGLMPTTALAATTVSNATELQNAIKNAKGGDTIILGGNITFSDSSQIKTVVDAYQNRRELTYSMSLKLRRERRPSLAGIGTGSWEDLFNPPWKLLKDFDLPKEFSEEDESGSLHLTNEQLVDGNGNVVYVKEHGDAITYLLIDGKKNLTIDLNGHTISGSHDDAYFSTMFITGNSTVTIKGSGGITSNHTAVTACGDGTTVTIEGGNFTGDTAVAAINSAEVYLNGGTYTGGNVMNRVVKTPVELTKKSQWEQEDQYGDQFGYEQIRQTSIYNGTASRTVPCSTLYSENGIIHVEEKSQATVKAPAGGTLFSSRTSNGIKVSGGSFEGNIQAKEAEVKGGIFTESPAGCTHMDFMAIGRPGGGYTVVKQDTTDFEAVIVSGSNSTYYEKFKDAASAVRSGESISLQKNLTGDFRLDDPDTYTLNLNGRTITGSVTVTAGSVTVQNGIIQQNGSGNALKTEGDGAKITANCTVNASGGTALNTGYNGKGGTVTVVGGTYTGALEQTNGGTLSISGGKFSNDPTQYLSEGLSAKKGQDNYYSIRAALNADGFMEIYNLSDLQNFASQVNDGNTALNAILMDNIDLGTIPNWTPIKNYNGTFDGNGYSITNMKITMSNTRGENKGFFGSVLENGTIKNLRIASGSISGSANRAIIGGIAARNNGTIQNCSNAANIDVSATLIGNYIGGIAGSGGGIIDSCYNEGDISCPNETGQDVCGIATNYTGHGMTVTNCYNTGKITGGYRIDGIGGTYTSNCFNWGELVCVADLNSPSAPKKYTISPVSKNSGEKQFYRNTTAASGNNPVNAQARNDAQFQSGSVAWELNNNSTSGAWYQTLGVDPYPVLDPTHARVYQSGSQYVNHTYNRIENQGKLQLQVPGGNTVAGITSELPKKLTVYSDTGDYFYREVSWDTSPLDGYNPNNKDQQVFDLNGTVYVTGLVNGGEKLVTIKVIVMPVRVIKVKVEGVPKLIYNEGDSLDLSGAKYKRVYTDVNQTEEELNYDSALLEPKIDGTTVPHNIVLSKEAHNGKMLVMGSAFTWETQELGTLTVRSADNTIQSIKVGNTEAVLGEDGEYTITLPKGSSLPEESAITVTPTDSSVQSVTKSLVEGSNNDWEITVTAESGSTATYYLQVNIDGWNEEAIDSLTQAWNGMDNKEWKPTQAEVQKGTSKDGDDNNEPYETQLRAWLIQTMVERGMKIPANVTADISAKDVVVASGKQVAVTLTGTSGENNAFTLKSAEGAVISYTVQKDSQNVSLNDMVLTVNPKDGTTGSTTLSFIAPSSITYAGEYTGTVTFTISVADVPTT